MKCIATFKAPLKYAFFDVALNSVGKYGGFLIEKFQIKKKVLMRCPGVKMSRLIFFQTNTRLDTATYLLCIIEIIF